MAILSSLIDGNGFVDNYAISEEKDYNYFDTEVEIRSDDLTIEKNIGTNTPL